MASRVISDEVNHRDRNLQIVHMALVQLARAVADGQVRTSLGDLDKLIRLESFLRDGPDSRQEIVSREIENKSDEQLEEMIREDQEALKRLKAEMASVDED